MADLEGDPPAEAPEPSSESASAALPSGERQHGQARLWALVVIVAAVVGGGGAYAWSAVRAATSSPYNNVAYVVPAAPHLVARSGETVYRIDPTQSTASYGVDEKIIGQSAHHATGTTNGIAGDIAVNPSDPSASRLGPIVINVQELHSDNQLRDARIRKDFLSSHADPLVTFTTTKLSGLPATLVSGHWYTFQMTGNLTVKGTTAPAVWNVRGQFAHGQLTATATSQVDMSTFHVGPISIAGLVSTSNTVSLTLQLVALDPSTHTIPDVISAPSAAKDVSGGPSFKTQILPILEQSCASCHNPGQVGASHWQLQTAGDAAAIADGIRVTTQAKYMPPWPASAKGVPLAYNPSLPQKTVDLLASWADHGGKLDVDPATPIVPSAAVDALRPRADVKLAMPKTYAGSLKNPNDYRCFVLDPGFTKPTYVTGYTFLADQITEIHHAQIFHINAAQASYAPQLQGTDGASNDGKAGWECYAGPDLPGGNDSGPQIGQGNLIGGWAPGQQPVIYPEHSGILFQPGDEMVLQVHYHYNSTPLPDRSGVSLQVESGAAKDVKRMVIENPLAPVEIPCDPGVKAALCNRDNAIQDDVREYGGSGAANEAGLLEICGKTSSELAATFHDGVASSNCTWPVPENGTIVGVTGHMHTLGKSIRLTLDPGTPQAKILLDIPTWNFDWQMNYKLATPIHVTTGESVEVSCSWDRSLDPNRPPKYIVFAEGTEDEMCFSTYALIPDAQGR